MESVQRLRALGHLEGQSLGARGESGLVYFRLSLFFHLCRWAECLQRTISPGASGSSSGKISS